MQVPLLVSKESAENTHEKLQEFAKVTRNQEIRTRSARAALPETWCSRVAGQLMCLLSGVLLLAANTINSGSFCLMVAVSPGTRV